MDLTLSDDQRSIIDSVRDVITDTMPMERVRAVLDGETAALDRLWSQAAELGWFGLGLPEHYGGTGFELVDEALLFKEIGRHLTPGPFLGSVLGARVAAVGGNADVAAAIVAGEARVGIAVAQPAGDYVLYDATHTSYLLVCEPERAVLVAADAATPRSPLPSIDELSVRESAGLAITPVAEVATSYDPIAARGCTLVAAILVGIAEATRDMSVGYAKTREQFGAAIGTFQAIKHRCADMGVAAALADAQLLFAALSVTEHQPDIDVQVSAARLVAGRAALSNARETIQVHGGMGFTWECDAHFFLKRTHAVRDLFGTTRDHQRVMVTATG
jgi:alkylation response protein AidB-like acyl-CoA dehydrogenase